jgi:rhomboid protease GluP
MGEVEPDHFPAPGSFEDDDIPVIGRGMLDLGPRVDFEAGMKPWAPWSVVLVVACLLVFGFQAARGGLEDLDALVRQGALTGEHVRAGEWWRLWSATFMHGSFDHILGNMLMLLVLGMACEHGFGGPQFLVLYLFAGLTGSLLSLLGAGPSVGASGAIFGLAGALIVLFWKHQDRLHLRDRRICGVLGFWALYQLVLGFLQPAVDNWAHLGGLLGGMLMALVLRPAVLEGKRAVARHPVTILASLLALAALVATMAEFLPRLTAR